MYVFCYSYTHTQTYLIFYLLYNTNCLFYRLNYGQNSKVYINSLVMTFMRVLNINVII